MPIPVGKYVRYWSGNAAAYGVVTEVRPTTYRIRVGGTGTIVEVPHGRVALHTALVASGIGVDPVVHKRVDVEGRWLYHATSFDLLPSLATLQGLVPRSRVNWAALGNDVWMGAEKAASRVAQADVSERSYFEELEGLSRQGSVPSSFLLGDVGEFLYAARRHDDALIGYVNDVSTAGKSPVVIRFKTGSMAWYQDPKSTGAVMTMNGIPLRTLEMKYVPGSYRGEVNGDALAEFILDDDDWIPCSESEWMESLRFARLMDF